MDVAVDRTVAVARAEAERMQTAIAGTERDARVSMSSDQFAVLSRLINLLCDAVTAPPGALGDPQYWVPLDIFKKVKDMALQLQAECEDLRTQEETNFTLLPGSLEQAWASRQQLGVNRTLRPAESASLR